MIINEIQKEKYLKIKNLINQYMSKKNIFSYDLEKSISNIVNHEEKENIHTLFTYHLLKIFGISEKRSILISSIISILEIKKNYDQERRLKLIEDDSSTVDAMMNIISHILTYEMKLAEKIKLIVISKIEEYKISYNIYSHNISMTCDIDEINNLNAKISIQLFKLALDILSTLRNIEDSNMSYLMMYYNSLGLLIENRYDLNEREGLSLILNQIGKIIEQMGDEFKILFDFATEIYSQKINYDASNDEQLCQKFVS